MYSGDASEWGCKPKEDDPKPSDLSNLCCPFCGRDAILHESRLWIGSYTVFCPGCGVTIGDTDAYGTTKEEVIDLWNRRAT